MRTVIDMTPLTRRDCLLAGIAAAWAGASPVWAASPASTLAAAWQGDAGYQVGLLAAKGGTLAVQSALDVPTRAHGLWLERGGATLLAVARRPGDWLLRWRRDGSAVAWHWIEPDRAFNGHVIASADGRTLYTTETDLETGAGLVGVRNAASLEKTAEWPTRGMDPHELLLDADGTLLVANGGIPTLPETGRLKINLERMDASLVRLDARDGSLRGQWRLADPRLSLRHIAWGAPAVRGQARTLCIALQGEHSDAQQKLQAPVLALFDGQQLRTAEAPQSLQGYGGDVAWAAGHVAVSCPRAQGVALWQDTGRWAGFIPLAEACALASTASAHLWAGGLGQALDWHGKRATAVGAPASARLDNHWLVV